MRPGDQELFYLLKAEVVVGNCALWWRANSQGYTCNLLEAGKYEREEAAEIQRSSRGASVALSCASVEGLVRHHVDASMTRDLAPIDLEVPHG